MITPLAILGLFPAQSFQTINYNQLQLFPQVVTDQWLNVLLYETQGTVMDIEQIGSGNII